MELKDAIQQIVQSGVKSMQPADLRVGTVTSTEPLKISINPAMAPLEAPLLYMTQAVTDKRIIAPEGALRGIACVDKGETLDRGTYTDPATGVTYDYVTINRALQRGDKVLLLRVQSGQKFIILSRVMGAE